VRKCHDRSSWGRTPHIAAVRSRTNRLGRSGLHRFRRPRVEGARRHKPRTRVARCCRTCTDTRHRNKGRLRRYIAPRPPNSGCPRPVRCSDRSRPPRPTAAHQRGNRLLSRRPCPKRRGLRPRDPVGSRSPPRNRRRSASDPRWQSRRPMRRRLPVRWRQPSVRCFPHTPLQWGAVVLPLHTEFERRSSRAYGAAAVLAGGDNPSPGIVIDRSR
jgi:hypothetical protein